MPSRRSPLVLAACALLLAVPALSAQETVDLKEAKRHIGSRIKVQGEVARVRDRSDGGYQLELGRSYPASPLVIIIPERASTMFGEVKTLKGKRIEVVGTVRPSVLEGSPPITGIVNNSEDPELIKAPSMVLREPALLRILPGKGG